MVKTFRHKGLEKLYETSNHQSVSPEHAKRLQIILARLDASASHEDTNLPGLRLHPLHGKYEGFWAVSVSGNSWVIFRFEEGNAIDVDYVDYH